MNPWDLLASSDSRFAVWAEEDWDDGITHCLARLELDRLTGWQSVLDLGCGIGRLTFPIAEAHPTWAVWGLDASSEMIRQARGRRDLSQTPQLHFVQGDGWTLPEDWSAMFSVVFSVLMLQHVPDDVVRGYFSEVRRCLAPGGWFRFQFAEGTEQGSLNFQRSRREVAVWLRRAGFDLVGTSGDSQFPTWCWVEAR